MTDKRMDQQDEQVLKWLLGQIFRAEKRKRQLDERLIRINEERNAPIGGQGYEPLPRGSSVGNGAASILFKLADIEERIYDQKAEIEKCIVRVMDILDYLPINSIGREICELRHIDMLKWRDIEDKIPMSHSQVNKNYRKAIKLLLTFPRIRQMVEDNRQSFEDYVFEQGERKIKADSRRGSKKQSGGSASENKSGNIQGRLPSPNRGIKARKSVQKK